MARTAHAGAGTGRRGDRGSRATVLAIILCLAVALAAACGGSSGSHGQQLFRSNCSACHGDSGARIPDVPLNDPGFLSRLGSGGLTNAISQGKGIMPAWGTAREGPLNDQSIQAIVDYMLSPDGLTAGSGPGRSLFNRNCASCHGSRGTRIPAAPLNSTTFIAGLNDDALRSVIERGKDTMPAFGKNFDGSLSDKQIDQLVQYVRTLAGDVHQVSSSSSSGGGDDGQQVFVSTCAACHGANGGMIASANLTSPDFLSSLPDDQLVAVISKGTGTMPPQATSSGGRLSDDQVNAVVAYLKKAAGVSSGAGPVPAGVLKPAPPGAQDLFKANCAGCHASMPVPDVDPTQLHGLIQNGLADKGMPAFGSRLSDADIEALASLVASGQPIGGGSSGDGAGSTAASNPFAGVVRHVDGWITQHPNVVRQQGSQLCQKCHQLTFCASCHTGG